VLEHTGFHPDRRARDHLRILGASVDRAADVLSLVGLSDASDRRVGGFSLGMRQRLGLASALVGDPSVLLLDEPANGLDPAGMAWLRSLLRSLASEGRTVLVSSHVLSEVSQTADDAVIVHEGQLRYAGPLSSLDGSLESAFLTLTGGSR
jgi:ABC-2 type transport system ATP-binding protein